MSEKQNKKQQLCVFRILARHREPLRRGGRVCGEMLSWTLLGSISSHLLKLNNI
jgi:hypothetical protein